jgi:uroporphyrinogen-III synthase
VENVFKLAQQDGLEAALPIAFAKILIASIGPVCSEALARFHLRADFEPVHPKMGFMIGALSGIAKRLLDAKRRQN